MSDEKIPFHVETRRIIELLATQIYQSPLAMLRENIQNAYDAILMRLARNEAGYQPQINVDISSSKIVIRDNGIGMSKEVIRNNFWMAGSSGKNNEAARAAGVVGTFGIGGMANFGIAGELKIDTESIESGERHISQVNVDDLELNTECIGCTPATPKGEFGTEITAVLLPNENINIDEARAYISEFASALPIPVIVNGAIISQKPIASLVPMVPEAWLHEEVQVQFSDKLSADVKIVISQNADIWISLDRVGWAGTALMGSIVLRSGVAHIRTFRSGFGLAPASAPSPYAFGGAVDLNNLFPTAGREALTTESVQFLHSIMPFIDHYVSSILANRPECDSSTPFMQWVASKNKFEFCGLLKMSVNPGGDKTLYEIQAMFQGRTANTYTGNDKAIISTYASEDNPLLVFSNAKPRRTCQHHYLHKYIKLEQISDSPSILSVVDDLSLNSAEGSMVFRIKLILEEDYFVRSEVKFANISHGVPVMVNSEGETLAIYIDRNSPAVSVVTGLYEQDFSAFSSIVKDFVRTNIFSRISQFVPSSTRNGAEEFLKAIKRKREVFEIDIEESDEFSSIWEQYAAGDIPMSEAITKAKHTSRSTFQTLDQSASATIAETLPDVVQEEERLRQSDDSTTDGAFGAEPPIMRTEISSSAKLLTIDPAQNPLHGYRCFLSLTDKARSELGEFFNDPHKTSVVWGGHRVLFIFMHHSDQYGLYYDIQTSSPVGKSPSGANFPSCTLVLKNKIFIPIPEEIVGSFTPGPGDKRKFEIRFDIIRSVTSG